MCAVEKSCRENAATVLLNVYGDGVVASVRKAGTASVPELPRCNAYYRSEIGGNVNYGTERNTSKHLCDSQKLI